MKAITYVGKKSSRSDSVAETGLVWKPGQVHVVTDAVAEKLLKHADVWAAVEIEQAVKDAGKKEEQDALKRDVTDLPKKEKPKDDMTPFERVNTRDMSLNALRAYARSHLNITLPARITEQTARAKVNAEVKLRNLRAREG